MSIRLIKLKERNNGMKYCTYCKPLKVGALWRDWRLNFACQNHKHELDSGSDDDHMTEADNQTWGRL